MVDSVVTKQELIDAQKDAQSLEDVINGPADTRVKPRIGPEMWTLATINSLVQQGQIKISDLSEAIQTALAAGAGSAGWTANLVADGNQTQKEINLFGGKKYDMPVGGYPLNSYVLLDNGDIVKSTTPNNTNNPNVDMTGWVNPEKDQKKINDILKTQSVNIKQFENALTDFSLAYYNALEFCRTNVVDTVYVPDGNYYSNNSVEYTLNKNIRMVFGTNVKIYQRTHNHAFDITQAGFTVEIDGNGAEIYPDWSTTPETDVIALKFNGWTSKRNFTLSGMNVLANPATSQEFTWAFHGLGLNYAGVGHSLFQAKNSVYFGSQPAGDRWTRAMGAEFSDVRCLASNIGVLVVNQGTYAVEGFKYKGGEILADVGIRNVDNISAGYYPPLFTVTDTHINARLALDLNGISRVQIKADIQAYVTSENTANGLIELSGVQELIFDGSNVSHAVADGSAISDAKPIFHIKSHPQGKISAFFNLGASNYWLSYAGTKLISFESDAVYSGQVALGNFPRSVFASKIVDKAYARKISAAESLRYEVADINSQLALSYDVTFASGVLTLGNPPLSSGIYVIPISVVSSGATITQIKCESRQGKLVDVVFEGENITFTHNANFFQPTGMTWRSTGARMGARIYFLNQNVAYIVATTGLACFSPVASVPANSSAYGQHGQKIFSAGFVYEYISGTGWVKYAAATF